MAGWGNWYITKKNRVTGQDLRGTTNETYNRLLNNLLYTYAPFNNIIYFKLIF